MYIGLTGSFGSGKSTVAEMLGKLGAVIIDADLIAREVAEPGGSAYNDIVRYFGRDYINSDGTLNRKKIAEAVFTNKEKLKKLNSIIHPRVREKELQLMKKYKDEKIVVFMIPLLFEVKFQKYIDRVIVVVVDDTIRIKRLTEKRKILPQEIENRLKNQISQNEKVRLADYIIDNSGSLDKTRKQILRLFNQLVLFNK